MEEVDWRARSAVGGEQMAGEPGGRSVAAAWESAPAAAACGGLSVTALSSVPGSLAAASVAVGR